jgi:magnesium transporter
VFIGQTATREEVVDWMRTQDLNFDQLDNIVLLDGSAQFSGIVPVARLLLSSPEQSVSELTLEPLLSVQADADESEVFELFDKYNLRTLTVVDEHQHPIGTIAVDDVVSRLVAK